MEVSKEGKTPLPEKSELDRFGPSVAAAPDRVLQFELGRREFVQFLGALATVGLIDGLDVLDVGTAFALEQGKPLFDPISAQPSGVGANQSANNAVRRTVTVSINHTKDQRWFISGSPDRVSNGQVDDALKVSGLETSQSRTFEYYTNARVFEIPKELLREGTNRVRVDLIDKIGPHWGCSALWLVGTGADGGGGSGGDSNVCRVGFEQEVQILHGNWKLYLGIFGVDLDVKFKVVVNTCKDGIVVVGFDDENHSFIEIKSDQGSAEINDKGFFVLGSRWQPSPSLPDFGSENSTEGVYKFKILWNLLRLDAGIFDVNLVTEHVYSFYVRKNVSLAEKLILTPLAIIVLAAFFAVLVEALVDAGVVTVAAAALGSLMLLLQRFLAAGGVLVPSFVR